MAINISDPSFQSKNPFGLNGSAFNSPTSSKLGTPAPEQRRAPLTPDAPQIEASPAQDAVPTQQAPRQRLFNPINIGVPESPVEQQGFQLDEAPLRPDQQFIQQRQQELAEPNRITEAVFQQLDGREPGRYRLLNADEYDAWHKEWKANQPSWVQDTLFTLPVGGAIEGTGNVIRGIGEAVRSLEDVTTTPLINAVFGTNFQSVNLLEAPADAVATYGQKMKSGISVATKEALAKSSPGGDFLDPTTWTLGEDPSLLGYFALTMDVFGQMAPIIAASVVGGGVGGAIAGGAQGGGAAADEARALIDKMAETPGLLEKESAYYRELISRGLNHEEAWMRTREAAAKAAFNLTAPVSGLGGAATAKLINPATKILAGRNLALQIAGRTGLSAAEEGTQEAVESMATQLGINVGAGANTDITDGTFGDFILGALAGGATGSGAGVNESIQDVRANKITDPKGAIGRAVQHGDEQTPDAPITPEPVKDEKRAFKPDAQEQAARAQEAETITEGLRQSTTFSEGAPVIVNHPDMGTFEAIIDSIEPEGAIVFDNDGIVHLVDMDMVAPREATLREGFDDVVAPDAIDNAIARAQPQEALSTAPEPVQAEFPEIREPAPVQAGPTVRDRVAATQQAAQVEAVNETDRRLGDRTVSFPDKAHADLYDLGDKVRKARYNSKMEVSKVKDLLKDDIAQIADALDITPDDAMKLADDYRVRTDSAAKGREGDFTMPIAGTTRVKEMQRAKKSADAKAIKESEEQQKLAAPKTDIDAAAQEAATSPLNDAPEPTQAQKEAGNYKKGHVNLAGLDISIENPKGSQRKGRDRDGKEWSVTMKSHYGYFKGTEGPDKDHIDTFVKDGTEALDDKAPVFVVDQVNEDGSFDEPKVMLGYKTKGQATKAYNANYEKGWKGLGNITQTTMGDLKAWFKDGDTKKPFARDEAKPEKKAQVGGDFDKEGNLTEEKPANKVEKAQSKPVQKVDPATKKKPASWVIKRKNDGAVVMETSDQKKIDALNTEKFEAVPIGEHLASLNEKPKTAEPEKSYPDNVVKADETLALQIADANQSDRLELLKVFAVKNLIEEADMVDEFSREIKNGASDSRLADLWTKLSRRVKRKVRLGEFMVSTQNVAMRIAEVGSTRAYRVATKKLPSRIREAISDIQFESETRSDGGKYLKDIRSQQRNSIEGVPAPANILPLKSTESLSTTIQRELTNILGDDAAKAARNATEPEQVKTKAKDEAEKPLARAKGPARGERQLYVVHNISAEGVKWADELGGLAAPSIAVAGADTGFDSFGEISLIGAPEMAEPDKSTRIFNADVYSPRQPRAEFDIKGPAFKRMMDKLDGAAAALGVSIQGSIYPEKVSREGLDAVAREDVTRMAYLMEQSKAPKVKYKKKSPVPDIFKKWLKSTDYNGLYEDADFNADALEYVKGQIEDIRSDFAKERAQSRWIVEEDGKELVSYSKIDEILNIMRESQRPPQVDGYETGRILRNRTQNAKGANKPEYTKWIEDNFGEVLYAKFFTDANQRRKPYELNALVRDMTRTIRDGEGFNYGVGSIRSTVAKQFKSLDQIKGDRGQIVDKKTMESMKEEVNKDFSDLADEFAPLHSSGKDFGWHDIFSDFLKDLANGNLREWQNSIFIEQASPELVAKARGFLDKLVDLPTEYFEIKMQRAVDLGEFHTALVPNGTPKEVVDTLRSKGLKIVKYAKDVEGNGRKEALDKVSSDVFFRAGVGAEPTNQNLVDMLKIVQEVGGLQEPEILDTILIDEATGWDMEGPAQAAGLYYPVSDLIVLAADVGDNRTAYHESFHRLQNLYLTKGEKRALKADAARLRRIIRSDPQMAPLVKGMSQNELEAEAFAIYAENGTTVRPLKSIGGVWDHIADLIDKIKAYLKGENINATTDLFKAAKSGDVAKRTQLPPSLEGAGVAPKVESEAFKKWFGDSQIVDENGKPLVVYHGSQSVIEKFDPERIGSKHGQKGDYGSGFYFSKDRKYTDRFGDVKTKAYLKIDNPFIIFDGQNNNDGPTGDIYRKFKRLMRAENPSAATSYLQGEGYDGVIVHGAGGGIGTGNMLEIVAFNADQIKTTGKESLQVEKPLTRPVTDRLPKNITSENLVKETIAQLKGKWTDLSPSLLNLIPLNYFEELAQPNMTAIKDYMRHKMAMDTFRGDQHAKADEVAQKWLKYVTSAGGYLSTKSDKARAEHLSELMHESTLAGVDPSSKAQKHVNHPKYEELRAKYDAMSPSGKELFKEVRDTYKDQSKLLDSIILDNIKKTQEIAQRRAMRDHEQAREKLSRKIEAVTKKGELDRLPELNQQMDELLERFKKDYARAKSTGAARLIKMRKMFEKTKAGDPYFPLARTGDYFVTVRNDEGDVISFSRREKVVDRDKLAQQMRDAYPDAKVETGVLESGNSDTRDAMDPRIVGDIQKILGDAGVDEQVQDMIWQRYLESMPDLSTRKRFIHRKGTSGFDADALKAFSKHMFHASHQMARLKYGMELQEATNELMDQAKVSDDPTKGVRLANQLKKNHQWVMNPTGNAFAQKMNSIAFVWFLGVTPAAALVNLTQTPMMGIPIIGARYGFDKAAKAMLKASKDSVMGKGSVGDSPHLTTSEKSAMEAFYRSGLIDKTQAHDLAGVGDTGVEYNPLIAKSMEKIGFFFHRAEVWNREVTALAAYRAAVESGLSHKDAIESAHDLTWKSHFDYSNSSRPSILQNDFAKVALVFRAHSINMIYRVVRDIHQSFKGDTPEARRIARRQLIGIFGMLQLMAGTTGLFGFNQAMWILGMIFGDDDDPLDFEMRMKKDLIDVLGPQWGGIILNGVPGHYTKTDLTSRIGMADIWFRSANRDMEGRDQWQDWILQGAGASVSMVGNWFAAADYFVKGQFADGIEMAAPKVVRDAMRGYRRVSDGVISAYSGNQIIAPEDISLYENLVQGMGFSPASVSETWERNSALRKAESKVMRVRSRLLNKYALAFSMRDNEAMKETIEEIKKFNKGAAHKGLRITGSTIKKSLKAHARNAKKREDGVIIQNAILNKRLRDHLPTRIHQ